jgi:hypothetical protein
LNECAKISEFWDLCYVNSSQPGLFNLPERDQPPIIQEWFDQWRIEASTRYGLHADIDREMLWKKFQEVLGQ